MNKAKGGQFSEREPNKREEWRELKLLVPDDLFRAWQRCSWLITNETGRSRTEVMAEMVRDFLVKHGC